MVKAACQLAACLLCRHHLAYVISDEILTKYTVQQLNLIVWHDTVLDCLTHQLDKALAPNVCRHKVPNSFAWANCWEGLARRCRM